MRPVTDIATVVERNLCCGCGACAHLEPARYTMVDDADQGRRPIVVRGAPPPDPGGLAVAACPGREVRRPPRPPGAIPELWSSWGPVLELWEGAAAADDVRFAGSSGGAATALAWCALEQGEAHGVLHTVARDDVPFLNTTVLTRDRDALVGATGSRYAPASPCDRLDLLERAPGPCVFIGKPCDVAGAAAAAAVRPELARNLGLTIALFCAGTPTLRGTLEMFERLGCDPAEVASVRYRGNGWPGEATVTLRSGERRSLSYDASWGEILQKHRQWRCYVCADHTGELADLSVGDPWYREIDPDEPGLSLIVVRTERGRRFLERAVAAGALALRRVDPSILPASQPNLERARGAVWGRSVALRLAGLPAPSYPEMDVRRTWWRALSWREKAQSVLGTLKRVRTKGLRRRRPVVPWPEQAVRGR